MAPVATSTRTSSGSQHASSEYKVWEAPFGTGRTVRVLCIGAGASGLNLAHQLVQDYGAVPGPGGLASKQNGDGRGAASSSRRVELTLYDKNPEVAGTWYENK